MSGGKCTIIFHNIANGLGKILFSGLGCVFVLRQDSDGGGDKNCSEFCSHSFSCHLLHKPKWLSTIFSKELQFGNAEPEKSNMIFLLEIILLDRVNVYRLDKREE